MRPATSVFFTSAPYFFTSSLTTSLWPSFAALCSAVCPVSGCGNAGNAMRGQSTAPRARTHGCAPPEHRTRVRWRGLRRRRAESTASRGGSARSVPPRSAAKSRGSARTIRITRHGVRPLRRHTRNARDYFMPAVCLCAREHRGIGRKGCRQQACQACALCSYIKGVDIVAGLKKRQNVLLPVLHTRVYQG